MAGPNFLDWKARSHQFESMAAWRGQAVTFLGHGEPEEMQAALVSADFFRTLGVAPMMGRGLLPGEDRGQGGVAVIGESLWRTQFGADPGILGRTINLSGTSYTIVGVAPASMVYPGRVQLWLPLGFGLGRASDRDSHAYEVVGRLKPGATLSDAQQDLSALARALTSEFPATNSGRGAAVIAFADDAVGSIRPALLLLTGAVAFVLLIACANVANLFLARASARSREVAVRAALGAGRGRLMQQALAEAVVLSTLGGALGLLVATWSVDALLALRPRGIPRLSEVAIDARVLVFTLAVSVGVGLVFGLVPALAVARHDPADSFRGEGKGTSSRRAGRFRAGLVVAQIALALVLLAGAALLIVSVRRLAGVDPGFRPEGAAAFQFNVPARSIPWRMPSVASSLGCSTACGRSPAPRAPARSSSCPWATATPTATYRWRASRRPRPGTSVTRATASSWDSIWRPWGSRSGTAGPSARAMPPASGWSPWSTRRSRGRSSAVVTPSASG